MEILHCSFWTERSKNSIATPRKMTHILMLFSTYDRNKGDQKCQMQVGVEISNDLYVVMFLDKQNHIHIMGINPQ